jgi:hypothetical protein
VRLVERHVPLPPATERGDEQKRGQNADVQEPDVLAHGGRPFLEVECHSGKLIGTAGVLAAPSAEGICANLVKSY